VNDYDMSEPYLIISSDTHAGPRTEQYGEYLEGRYQEAFRDYLARQAATAEARAQLHDQEFVQEWQSEHKDEMRANWDAHQRDNALDSDSVTGEVIFPDADAVSAASSVPFGAGIGMIGDYEPELALAGARAHNRWLAGLCQDSPDRRRGVIIAPIVDNVEGAVAEIRRAHADGLRGGIMIPSYWGYGNPPYHDRCYEPVWAACQELRLPVQTHAGAAPSQDLGTVLGLYATEVAWWSARPMWFLLWAGVFERFPRLRFGVQEAGIWWVADMLWRMDAAYDREFGTRKLAGFGEDVKRRPSEYFDRNCFVGASTATRREYADRHQIGVGSILWGNDFPHPEGTWPYTREWLAHLFAGTPVDETRLMLGLAAAAEYDFDVEKLTPVARRIGPTPADLGQDALGGPARPRSAAADRHWLTGPDIPEVARALATR
jgi:predicted TIM-barrel fold metal-dependent hydrolase